MLQTENTNKLKKNNNKRDKTKQGKSYIVLAFWFSHGVWMRFADDVSEILVGSIFKSSGHLT